MEHAKTSKRTWWKHGVIYHIYPRSFYDANNDGIGDLPGIIHQLDYLKTLGVDALWLSPINLSPQVDFGYDVADYRQIDPVFGTLDDFKKLLEEAHQRELRVIMDLIMNHTSNQHPWFIESAASRNNPKRDWYIWQDGKNGKVPNNWKTNFGSCAWEYDKKTKQYYYHSFLKEQPDLNWRNIELKKAFFKEIEFWLDMGVDGFRLDVINLIVKDKKLRDNPSLVGMLSGKKQIYTRNRPKTLKILKKFRKLLDTYDDRMSVGEIYSMPPGDPALSAEYLGTGKDSIHLTFDFSLIFKLWSARNYSKTISRWYKNIPPYGWPCNVLSNHDLHRSFNRPVWRLHKTEKAKIAAFLLLTIKGTPFIYYGEEIGMKNKRMPRRLIKDSLGRRFWPFYNGRDKARTPMQWNNGKYAGFSPKNPWLPVNKNYKTVNVETQKNNPNSLFCCYQNLLELRRNHPALYAGNWVLLDEGKNGIMIYKRSFKDETIIVLLNFKSLKRTATIDFPLCGNILLSTHRINNSLLNLQHLNLYPFEATIVSLSAD